MPQINDKVVVFPIYELLFALLVCCCLLLLYIFISLKRNHQRLVDSESELKTKYQELEKRLLDRNEKMNGILNQLFNEIAKHEDTEELLRKSQEYAQNIINSMPSIIIGVTQDGIITHWNTAARKATGIKHETALGLHLSEVAKDMEIDEELIDRAINLHQPQKREGRKQGHSSQAQFTDLIIYPLLSEDIEGAVIRIDDVTLRIQLETMMVQNEKMNSLGELAAGVAHEINNPLGTILQTLQNIKRRTSPEFPANDATAKELGVSLKAINEYLEVRNIMDFLNDIKDAGERAMFIVKHMLEFSRAQDRQYHSINIVELLDRSIDLAQNAMNAKPIETRIAYKIEKNYPELGVEIPCSPVEIQQVILNLLSNAYHAYAEKEHGEQLTIRVNLSYTDKEAIIEISDNGPGMDSWTQKHIFDPFFTTKEVGKGTGLGLSVSYFIITEHHQGSISVDSAINQGTSFTIRLPIIKETNRS